MPTKILTLAATLVTVLCLAAPAHAATDLAAHWRFDEGAGATAADSSGFGQTGTVLGVPTWVTGKRGGALSFDGGANRVTVASQARLETPSVTVSAWVKNAGGPGPFKYIVAKGASGCIAASYALYTGPGGGLQFYVSDGAGAGFVRSPAAAETVWDGGWHHVAGTYDRNAVRLYVDGAEVGSGTPASIAIDYVALDTRDVLVGSYAGCNGLSFSGGIDEPRIWGRALTGAEVMASVGYDFKGFYAPIDNLPTLNEVTAGRAVSVKFSLSGFQGMAILESGSPSSQPVACGADAPVDAVEETVTAGSSSLSYDATADRYSYVWKTDRAWAGTCRRLDLRLDDGTTHTAAFKFKR